MNNFIHHSDFLPVACAFEQVETNFVFFFFLGHGQMAKASLPQRGRHIVKQRLDWICKTWIYLHKNVLPFKNPCFTNPCFTNTSFTNPCFTIHLLQFMFYKSSPCLQIQSSLYFTICQRGQPCFVTFEA